MTSSSSFSVTRLLAEYGVGDASFVSLGSQGGFSGAGIFRVTTSRGDRCLRAWPAGVEAGRVESIHRLMNRGRCLAFVPRVERTVRGETTVMQNDRVWDLTTWLPGIADFRESPSERRLEAACRSLALIHAVWLPQGSSHGPCPAVRRRVEAMATWQSLWSGGWRPDISALDPVAEPANAALRALPSLLPKVAPLLAPWQHRAVRVQPCLCDVWHDHVLFSGEDVTGIVDYGSVKQDHVAVDLARLLGSLVPDQDTMTRVGLAAYESVRPLLEDERELVRILDVTGRVLGIANWLRWLYHEQREYEDRHRVAARLAELVGRLPHSSRFF